MSFRVRGLVSVLCVLLFSSACAVPSPAQFQNPITAAKDAYKKAKEQQRQQQQQQQQQQNPGAQPNSSAAPAAKSTGSATASTTSAEAAWTPPAEEAAAPVRLDPMKLPDVIGIRLGIAADEALALVHKQLPGDIYEKMAANWWPGPEKPDYGYTVLSSAPGNDADVHLSFTAPPGPQVLWRLARYTHNVNINHGTMLAALRAKYGKETFALTENGGSVVTDDRAISQLYWLYNEKGDRIPSPPSSPSSNTGALMTECWNPTSLQPIMPSDASQVANYKGWCSTPVFLHIIISPQEIVRNTITEMVDVPLAIRTARAAGAYQARIAEEQHRRQVERSKAVTPTL